MTITLNDKQAKVVVEALDAYSRLFSGQISIALEYVYKGSPREKYPNYHVMRELERKINAEVLPALPPDAHYGILCSEMDNRAKIAYDMYQLLREVLHPRDKLMLNTSGEPEITITE